MAKKFVGQARNWSFQQNPPEVLEGSPNCWGIRGCSERRLKLRCRHSGSGTIVALGAPGPPDGRSRCHCRKPPHKAFYAEDCSGSTHPAPRCCDRGNCLPEPNSAGPLPEHGRGRQAAMQVSWGHVPRDLGLLQARRGWQRPRDGVGHDGAKSENTPMQRMHAAPQCATLRPVLPCDGRLAACRDCPRRTSRSCRCPFS